MTKSKFYVYLIRDPRPDRRGTPVYIGKGSGRRIHAYRRNDYSGNNSILQKFLTKCKELKLEVPIEIVKYFDNEANAFKTEIALIAKYGRRILKTGTLYNITSGGESPSGYNNPKNSEQLKKRWNDPKQRKIFLINARKVCLANGIDPILRKTNSARMRKEHAAKTNTKRATAFKKVVTSAKFRKAQSRRFSKTLKALWNNPQYHKTMSTINRKRQSSTRIRNARTISARKQWDDPKFANRMRVLLIKRNKSRKQRQRVSLTKKQYWASRGS